MDLRIKNVRKDFDLTPALHDVSLDIASGELVALVGPSGSGKTTLLRLIAGLEQPNAGTVYFGQDDASRLSVQDRQVGFVFQHYALFKHMTVLQNVGFGLTVRPRGKRPTAREINERARSLIELVQLAGFEDRYPSQLSGGQRQRVALARAMAIEPKVLLLDEPFGALDAQVRKDLRRWLRELHDVTGHTTVFVTHDQEEAMELADRVVVMSRGRIEQVGAPDAIYDTPASAFVHRFIGESVELPVYIEGGMIRLDGIAIPLSAADEPDGPAALVFRPYDVAIDEVDRATYPGIAATVVASRWHGRGRRLELAVGAGGHSMEIDLPPDVAPPVDSTLSVWPTRWTLYRPSGASLSHPTPAAAASMVSPIQQMAVAQ
ncbi:sulfate/molybdate ABC transporter ATP-binding protein [Acuticoccus mangrovi]|uniref:Sulfate/molybdate ABC transporter ATP-binding protein n=1 Tax=Acuticoccus mangrovi TaxID=2796142 RepID=A0A934INV5_9HYPH|nr:sulfate/molybdate ABC transporter ATP-binding protein [Acuticoccus mangrovi]MBJ3778351.1 sulfate/molybdate ABC transporter ATP-binding protein [Acuticoccus mangrovi]